MSTRRLRGRLLLVLVALMAVFVSTTGPVALAHTEVQSAEPGPAEVVAAGVDSVELRFLDPVLDGVTIEVVDADDAPVAGLGAPSQSDDDLVATVGFEPLDAGVYVVEYTFTAEDGDDQEERYRFTVEPADETPVLGTSRVGWGMAMGIVVVLGAGVVLALQRRSRAGHAP